MSNSGISGGELKGKAHSECDDDGCGIKAIVDGTKTVELQGKELIINADAAKDPEVLTVTGTKKQIASAINSDKGYGVEIESGAKVERTGETKTEPTQLNNEPSADVFLLGGQLSGKSGIEFSEIDDSLYSWKYNAMALYSLYKAKEGCDLDCLIDHPTLFERYKGSRYIKVRFFNGDENKGEVILPKTLDILNNLEECHINITLNFDHYEKTGHEFRTIESSEPDLARESILLHECQHLLSAIHNRPAGTSHAEASKRADARMVTLRANKKAKRITDKDASELWFYESLKTDALHSYFYYSDDGELEARKVVRIWLKNKGIRYVDPLTEEFDIILDDNNKKSGEILERGGEINKNEDINVFKQEDRESVRRTNKEIVARSSENGDGREGKEHSTIQPRRNSKKGSFGSDRSEQIDRRISEEGLQISEISSLEDQEYENGGEVKPIRFESGKKLTPEEKKEVYRTLRDSYKELRRPYTEENDKRVWLGDASDYMVKSSITGRMLRWFIGLPPDGRIAHPTEVFGAQMPISDVVRVQNNLEYHDRQSNLRYNVVVKRLQESGEIEKVVDALKTALENGATFHDEFGSDDIGKREPYTDIKFSHGGRRSVPDYVITLKESYLGRTQKDLVAYRIGESKAREFNHVMSDIDWKRFYEEFGDGEKFKEGGEIKQSDQPMTELIKEIGGNYTLQNQFGSFTSIKVMPIDENLKPSKEFFSVQVTLRAKNNKGEIVIQKKPLKTIPISEYEAFISDLEKRGAKKFEDGGEVIASNIKAMEKELTKSEKLIEGRKKAYLSRDIKYNGKIMSTKEWLDTMISEGKKPIMKEVVDTAKKNQIIRDWDFIKGIYPMGNSNHPQTIEAMRLKKIIDSEDFPKKMTYRAVGEDGSFNDIEKFGYEYLVDKIGSSKQEERQPDYVPNVTNEDVDSFYELGRAAKFTKSDWDEWGNPATWSNSEIRDYLDTEIGYYFGEDIKYLNKDEFEEWLTNLKTKAGEKFQEKMSEMTIEPDYELEEGITIEPNKDQNGNNLYGATVRHDGKEVAILTGIHNKKEIEAHAKKILSELKSGTYKGGWSFEDIAGRKNIRAIEKGKQVETEHLGTLEKVASGEVSPIQGVEEISKDHIAESPVYYDELEKMEEKLKHMDYKTAIQIPKGGAVEMGQDNLNAQAAETIASKQGLRAEALYNWANKFGVDLPSVGHILSDTKYNTEILDDVLNDKYDSVKKIIDEDGNACNIGEVEISNSKVVDGKFIQTKDVVAIAFDSALKTKEYLSAIDPKNQSIYLAINTGKGRLSFKIPQWHIANDGKKLWFHYNEGAECPYTFVESEQTTKEMIEGKKIEPHKEVSTSISSAIKDVISADKFRNLDQKEATLLYNLFDNYEELQKDEDDFMVQDYDVKEDSSHHKAIQSLQDMGYLYYFRYSDQINSNQPAIDFINAVRARVETRKNVKQGTDLFPAEANIPEFMAKGIYKDIKSCLLEDGDDQNDYLVEGTVIHNREKTDTENWAVVEFNKEGLIIRHLPKSVMTDRKEAKEIKYTELIDLFRDESISIEGITDLKTLKICIKAIKKCIESIDEKNYRRDLISRIVEVDQENKIKQQQIEEIKVKAESDLKAKDPKHYQQMDGIEVGQDHNVNVYGFVKVIDIEEKLGDKKAKIPYEVEFATDWGGVVTDSSDGSGIEVQSISGFKKSIIAGKQLSDLVGKYLHIYALGEPDPIITTVDKATVSDPKFLKREIFLFSGTAEEKIPLAKLNDLFEGNEIELTDSKGEPYIIVLSNDMRVDPIEPVVDESIEMLATIEGLELIIGDAKGKEKKEMQATIDGLRLLLEDFPEAKDVVDNGEFNPSYKTWFPKMHDLVITKEGKKAYISYIRKGTDNEGETDVDSFRVTAVNESDPSERKAPDEWDMRFIYRKDQMKPLDESNVNSKIKTHTYKVGDEWRSDFDYEGMLNYALGVNAKTSVKTLEKLADSMRDVNYHTAMEHLNLAISELKTGNKASATKHISKFKTDIKLEKESLDGHYAKGGEINSNVKEFFITVPKGKEYLLKEENHYDVESLIEKSLTKKWFGHGSFAITDFKTISPNIASLKIKVPNGKEYLLSDDQDYEFTSFIEKKLTSKWHGNGRFDVRSANKFEKGGEIPDQKKKSYEASNWWSNTLSSNEQNSLLTKYDENFNKMESHKVGSSFNKNMYPSQDLIIEIWEKEVLKGKSMADYHREQADIWAKELSDRTELSKGMSNNQIDEQQAHHERQHQLALGTHPSQKSKNKFELGGEIIGSDNMENTDREIMAEQFGANNI